MVAEIKEVREGYKMTELGEIPIEWNVATLGEVLRVGYGKSQKNVEVEKSDIPILGTGGIIGWAKKPLFEKPSVLIGRKGTIDKPQFMEKPFWTIDTLFYTDIHIEITLPKFIYYVFQTIDWYKYNEATGVPSLSATNISKIKHSFPPLKEQQKIAEILSTIDKQIENTDELIAKTKELKKGLMQQLLIKGIGHTEFKQTELGEIPVEWEVDSIKNTSSFCSNGFVGTATPFYTNKENGILYLQSNNIRGNKFDFSKKVYINEEFTRKYTKAKVETNDLLTVQSGHIGITNVVPPSYAGVYCHALIITRPLLNKINPYYLAFYLNSDIGKKRLSNIFVGSTIKHINVKDLIKFTFPVPSLNEQQKMTEILSTVDNQIETYTQEKQNYTELKKGLMQQLLTGKVRVTV